MLDSLGAVILLEGKKFYRVKGKIKIEGNKEEVTFDPYYGWLTEDERFNLRQTDPRYAP
ncbi:MAG: hypothetical protein PHP25_01205 [Candidatus Moranbacteria bacterium]|nr:hypothetical protein [Candidatus Moranbacteria bacterium]